jgi:diguanylate cyclase (GGDEF)-like protein
MYDPLTDLPNCTMFLCELDAALARAQRTNGAMVIMLIDLDRFKQVNDTYGHAAGDRLLMEVAGRLRRCVREGDLVGRLGGDEFALVAEGREKAYDVAALADRIIAELREPAAVKEAEITSGASVGITVYPDDLSQRDELLEHADRALYAAKAAGGGCWAAFVTPPATARECVGAI